MSYVIFNEMSEILRTVICSPSLSLIQAKGGGFIMKGVANDRTQKVEFDGLDDNGQPINPRVVDKPLNEIKKDNPQPEYIPSEKQMVGITKGQYQNILSRLKALEEEVRP